MFLYHVMIVDPRDCKVLVNADHQLPVVDFDASCYGDIEEMFEVVESTIKQKLPLVFLRCEAEKFCSEANNFRATLLIFEVQDVISLEGVHPFTWILQRDSDTITVSPINNAVSQYLQKYKCEGLEVHSNRLWPHSRSGWYACACAWMKNHLFQLTGQHVTSITKVSHFVSGCVLRARTEANEVYYLKAVIPNKSDELRVAVALGELLDPYFPKPLATDDECGYILMKDYGELLRDEDYSIKSNPNAFRHVLNNWAHVQKQSMNVVDKLIQRGVPLCDIKFVREKLTEVTSDSEWFDVQLKAIREKGRQEYTQEEYKQKFMEYVDLVLDKIEELGWPLSLVHGDFLPANIAKDKVGNLTYFDYEATTVGYGFLDADSFSFGCNGCFVFDDIEFYIKEWTECVSETVDEGHLHWMEAFTNLLAVYHMYDFWVRSEECGRKLFVRDMGRTCLVYRYFT